MDRHMAFGSSNGTGLQYYSQVPQTFSRIDCLFVPTSYTYRVSGAEILSRGLSDHAPISLSLRIGPNLPPFADVCPRGISMTNNI